MKNNWKNNLELVISTGSGSTSGPINFDSTGSTATLRVGYYKKEIGEDGSTDLDALFENAQKFRYQNCLEEVRRIRDLIEIIKNNNTIVEEVEVPYQPKPDNMPHRKSGVQGRYIDQLFIFYLMAMRLFT